MIRDIDFIRDCLIEIEQNAQPLESYPITKIMISKGYDSKFVAAHLQLMEEAGLFNQSSKVLSRAYYVVGLSNKGYDFLETIKNEEIWKKTKKHIEDKKLPKTIEYIAQIAGIFMGEFIKHSQ